MSRKLADRIAPVNADGSIDCQFGPDRTVTRTGALTVKDLLDELFGEDGYEVTAHRAVLYKPIVMNATGIGCGFAFVKSFTLGEADLELGAT